MRRNFLITSALFISVAVLWSAAPLSPDVQAVLKSITPGDLKGDLSFLASDTLQGRYTPSPGLEVAAEFIASQFRAAGLEPGGDQDYFQMAAMVDRTDAEGAVRDDRARWIADIRRPCAGY